MKAYAAIHKDEAIRLASSSGGVFTALAECTIRRGGVVFGARFDAQWHVVIGETDSLSELASLRGSKYVQARIDGAYERAEALLQSGREVLFSATPCQIAGLKRHLKQEYSNLLCVECACHGVPPSRLWEQYLMEVCQAGGESCLRIARRWSKRYTIDDIAQISFRDKVEGWARFHFTLQWKDGRKMSAMHDDNLWMRGLMHNLTLSQSCYQCAHKLSQTEADITLADLWGAEQLMGNKHDDKGLSLVVVHTDKGRQALTTSQVERLQEIDVREAGMYNHALYHSVQPHPSRDVLKARLQAGEPLTTIIRDLTRDPLLLRIKLIIAKLLHL